MYSFRRPATLVTSAGELARYSMAILCRGLGTAKLECRPNSFSRLPRLTYNLCVESVCRQRSCLPARSARWRQPVLRTDRLARFVPARSLSLLVHWLSDNVSVVHDVPEPGKARRRHVRALPTSTPFTACAASARQRALREITCYLQYHEPKVAQCPALASAPAPWPRDKCSCGADKGE